MQDPHVLFTLALTCDLEIRQVLFERRYLLTQINSRKNSSILYQSIKNEKATSAIAVM